MESVPPLSLCHSSHWASQMPSGKCLSVQMRSFFCARLALQDFDMLLLSVLPYKAFSRFLHKQHPEMVPYLQMVHLCKLTQEDQEMLQELKEI